MCPADFEKYRTTSSFTQISIITNILLVKHPTYSSHAYLLMILKEEHKYIYICCQIYSSPLAGLIDRIDDIYINITTIYMLYIGSASGHDCIIELQQHGDRGRRTVRSLCLPSAS